MPGPSHHGHATRAAVWICEYPYPTMRLTGPSPECDDCPVWRALEDTRLRAADRLPVSEEVQQLELMLSR